MDRKKELQKIVKRCADILKDKYKVRKVILIGSLVKGIVHEKSDIDLVVTGLDSSLYIKALTDLWDVLPSKVELNLISFEDAFKSLKEKAVKEGVHIYG